MCIENPWEQKSRTHFFALAFGTGKHAFAVAGKNPIVTFLLAGFANHVRFVSRIAQNHDLRFGVCWNRQVQNHLGGQLGGGAMHTPPCWQNSFV
jgi:hypothetical protein